MSSIHADLLSVLDAVEIRSPTRFAIRDEVRVLHDGPPLVPALATDLYTRLYIQPSTPDGLPPSDLLARRDFLAALSAANAGRGTWERGWTFRRFDEDGRAVVSKDDITFWVPPSDLRTCSGTPLPSGPCLVRVAKELRYLVPGFYLAIGDGEGDDGDLGDDSEPLVRFYWALRADAAVPFLATATSTLNEAGLPLRVKVLRNPDAYARADAGVLYLRRRYCDRLGDRLVRIHDAIATGLRPEVPLFTRKLADGLGVAEDPADGSSFGEHRCRVIANGLWESFEKGDSGPEDRAATLEKAFREAGLDPMLPHLQPLSRDDYAFRTPPVRREARPARDSITTID